MQKITVTLLLPFVLLVLMSCSNKDEVVPPIDQEISPLTIISYFPTNALAGDEVTIIAEGIDTLETYNILFNSVLADSVNITETEFKVRVPEDATSGIIIIDFLDFQNEVGTIEITQELDRVYILGTTFEYPTECDLVELYELNITTMELNGLEWFHNSSCEQIGGQGSIDGMTLLSKEHNIATYFFEVHTTQGEPNNIYAKSFNLNTFEFSSIQLQMGFDYNWFRHLSAVNNNSLYFTQYYRYDIPIGETYRLYSKDLITLEEQIVYEFPIENQYDLRISSILPSTNTLFSYTKDNNGTPLFLKLNLNTSEINTIPLPNDTEYSNVLVNEEERIFVSRKDPITQNRGQIIEIDPENGLTIAIIATLEEGFWVKELQYSSSTGRIFGLITGGAGYHLYKLNLNTGNSSKTLLPEGPRYYYLYIN